MDEDDADPVQFATYLNAAMNEATESSDVFVSVDIVRSAETILEAMAKDPSPLVLFLDDYHRAECEAVRAFIIALIDRASPALHIVLLTRVRPMLPLARLLSAALARILTIADLRFTYDEALSLLGADPGNAGVGRLIARAEGWPALLSLAKRWTSANQGLADSDLPALEHDFAAYFAEQVFIPLDASLQGALLDLSLFEHFNAALLNALRGCVNGGEVLQQLEKLCPLIEPIAASCGWFRMHALFSDFLVARLHAGNAPRVELLHEIGAKWFHMNGLAIEAVRHFISAGRQALGPVVN